MKTGLTKSLIAAALASQAEKRATSSGFSVVSPESGTG